MKYELYKEIEKYYKARPQLPQPEKSVLGYSLDNKMLPFIEDMFNKLQPTKKVQVKAVKSMDDLIKQCDMKCESCEYDKRYTIEPHGKGLVLYRGRCRHKHGYNLLAISEVGPKFNVEFITRALNGLKTQPSIKECEECYGKVYNAGHHDGCHDAKDMAYMYDDSWLEDSDRIPDLCCFCGGTTYNGLCSVCGEEN